MNLNNQPPPPWLLPGVLLLQKEEKLENIYSILYRVVDLIHSSYRIDIKYFPLI
jgi:hypothetical protein